MIKRFDRFIIASYRIKIARESSNRSRFDLITWFCHRERERDQLPLVDRRRSKERVCDSWNVNAPHGRIIKVSPKRPVPRNDRRNNHPSRRHQLTIKWFCWPMSGILGWRLNHCYAQRRIIFLPPITWKDQTGNDYSTDWSAVHAIVCYFK